MAEKKSCKFAGFEYPDGSKICKTRKCVICKDGEWEETGESCPC